MSLFRPHLYRMSAYQPPLEGRSAKKHLLLDFNERTLPVDPAIEKALIKYIRGGSLQKYPSYGDIAARIANYAKVPESNLMITNGSDQGIDLVIRAVCTEGDEAIIPAPSFAIYRQFAEVENATIVEPLYTQEGGYPVSDVISLSSSKTRLIVISNPNNPSGTGVERKDIERILKAAPQAAVLVDECYYEYFGKTVVDLCDTYPNLVVTRTFSKTWGLSSLRLGFLVSNSENIEQLLKIRGPYDVNQLAVVAVEAALENPEYTKNYVKEVMKKSKPALEKWLRGRKIDCWPSDANFLWTFPPQAPELAEFLESKNILVRPKKDVMGRMGLRINLGSLEQTEVLIKTLNEFYD
jgi:histidinol-phosphate aminotransferase